MSFNESVSGDSVGQNKPPVFKMSHVLSVAILFNILVICVGVGLYTKPSASDFCLSLEAINQSKTPEACMMAGGQWKNGESSGACSQDHGCYDQYEAALEIYQRDWFTLIKFSEGFVLLMAFLFLFVNRNVSIGLLIAAVLLFLVVLPMRHFLTMGASEGFGPILGGFLYAFLLLLVVVVMLSIVSLFTAYKKIRK